MANSKSKGDHGVEASKVTLAESYFELTMQSLSFFFFLYILHGIIGMCTLFHSADKRAARAPHKKYR